VCWSALTASTSDPSLSTRMPGRDPDRSICLNLCKTGKKKKKKKVSKVKKQHKQKQPNRI
jgi:hypothetical protein